MDNRDSRSSAFAGFLGPRRHPTPGWDPREPGILILSVLLFLIAGLLPWWGFVVDTSRIPYRMTEGTDFGPWFDEEWQFQVLPGTARRTGFSQIWWDFIEARPQYGGYATSALFVSVLWPLAVSALAIALVFRARPRSRMRGLPTALQAVAAAAVWMAILAAALGFPLGTEYSFVGGADKTSWGPRLGWFVAILAAAFASISTVLGRAADRSLRGRCWKCFSPVADPVCGYCSSPQ